MQDSRLLPIPRKTAAKVGRAADSASSKMLLGAALDAMPVGFVTLDERRVVQYLNTCAAAFLGLSGPLQKHPFARVLKACSALDDTARQILGSAVAGAGETLSQELVLTLGGAGPPRSIAVDIRQAAGCGLVLSMTDVTQNRLTHDWLLEHVSSDPVTGLWNRQHFTLMLQDALRAAPQFASGPAVMLVKLHRFKLVNDTLGNDAGDMLLRMVGDRICGLLREEDMLARSAGNEFAIALVHAEGSPAIAGRAANLLEQLSLPYTIEGQQISLGARIGIAAAPADGNTAEILLAHAALALQDATASADLSASGRLRFFDAELTQRARRRRGLEADLRRAGERGEFALHYQPQVDVHGTRVTGLEALIRWQHGERGMVPPGDFIHLAEEIGLIVPIGDWVLREACREAATWPAEIAVAVNASPLQFETGDFARSVADVLASTGLPAGRLEIEITESLLLRDTGTVMATLSALQALGVRLVLDDFGTGYASLSQLSRFRFDKIKIDRSFVSPADPSAEHSAIVRSIAALAHSLGIPSTAEGVETQTQWDQIKAHGCTSVQGYFLSRPVPANDVPAVLARLHRPMALAAA